MAGISRRPTPAGPITQLFDRLHDLHMSAGQPSIRDINLGIGRNIVSSSTVHNVFRGPKVPRWSFLELIVSYLDGDVGEFRGLWRAAREAELALAESGVPPAADQIPERPGEVPAPRRAADRGLGPLPRAARRPAEGTKPAAGILNRHWSEEIPERNPYFIGRDAELARLRDALTTGSELPVPQVICGIAGVGKTEIATEYVHRHLDDYEIIWWIRAEHQDRIRDALVDLGPRLGLSRETAGWNRDRAIEATRDALGNGVRQSWLLVFDNAAQPLDLQGYLPPRRANGHVIITSRPRTWPRYIGESIEIAPFTTAEAVGYLNRRVAALRGSGSAGGGLQGDASRLAEALGNLPIAIEHAAAYLEATALPVDDYLTLLAANAGTLPDADDGSAQGRRAVSATWTTSSALLSPDAEMLGSLCAFFSPEPISMELLARAGAAIESPPRLREVLGEPVRFRAARNELNRLSLVKLDGARNLIHVHRVVQAVARDLLAARDPQLAADYRAAFHSLLAASDPGNPDHTEMDAAYELSYQHIEAGQVLDTDSAQLRALIINQTRRLHLRGRHVEAVRLGEEALDVWRPTLGADHIQVLELAVELAIAMRMDGRAADARQLTLSTLKVLENRYGPDHPISLLCANSRGGDLRALGQFDEALNLDRELLPRFERVFSPRHERTLNVLNNIAADHRRLGEYEDAHAYDEKTYADRTWALGGYDARTLVSLDAIARDLRGLGRYEESLEMARELEHRFTTLGVKDSIDRLEARKNFAVALRKSGYTWDALQVSEDVVRRYREFITSSHAHTLKAASNLIVDRRLTEDLKGAENLGREMLRHCQQADQTDWDVLYATMVNLASVLRVSGHPAEAARLDAQAAGRLTVLFGHRHPFTLAAAANHASDLAALGDLAMALRTGRETVRQFLAVLGPDHPDVLAATNNLAQDLLSAGETAEAERLYADCRERYEQTMTLQHPDARWAVERGRVSIDLEPY